MALDGDRLGAALKAVMDAAKPAAGEEITDAQLLDLWKAFGNEITNEFKNNGAVSTNGVTGTGPAGGPLPITAQPGVIT